MGGAVDLAKELLGFNSEGVDELDKCTNLLGVVFNVDVQAKLTGAIISNEVEAVSSNEYN